MILKLACSCCDCAESWSMRNSRRERKDFPRWQFWRMIQASEFLDCSMARSAMIPCPCPSEMAWMLIFWLGVLACSSRAYSVICCSGSEPGERM